MDTLKQSIQTIIFSSVLLTFPGCFFGQNPVDSAFVAGLEKEIRYVTGEELENRIKNGKPTFVYFWATWCEASKLTLKTYLSRHIEELRSNGIEVLIICAGGVEAEIKEKFHSMETGADTVLTLQGKEPVGGNALVDKHRVNELLNTIFPGRETENKMPIFTYSDKQGTLVNDEPGLSLTKVLQLAGVDTR